MDYITCIALFLMGLLLLVKGADEFLSAALWFARRFNISELIIGASIVSIGTTLPETTVSAMAAFHGSSGIAYGNAIGSIICNAGIIVGLVFILSKPKIKIKEFSKGAIFFFIAAAVFTGSALLFWGIPRLVALILLGTFIVFMIFQLKTGKSAQPLRLPQQGKVLPNLFKMFISACVLFYGSNLMVKNAEMFAFWLAVPEEVIALTIVALGTSLPEFATAIISVYKGHSDLSVGNILGANFLNLCLVVSISALIDPMVVDALALRTDIIVMYIVMLLFTLPVLLYKKSFFIQGVCLISVYLFYVLALFH